MCQIGEPVPATGINKKWAGPSRFEIEKKGVGVARKFRKSVCAGVRVNWREVWFHLRFRPWGGGGGEFKKEGRYGAESLGSRVPPVDNGRRIPRYLHFGGVGVAAKPKVIARRIVEKEECLRDLLPCGADDNLNPISSLRKPPSGVAPGKAIAIIVEPVTVEIIITPYGNIEIFLFASWNVHLGDDRKARGIPKDHLAELSISIDEGALDRSRFR